MSVVHPSACRSHGWQQHKPRWKKKPARKRRKNNFSRRDELRELRESLTLRRTVIIHRSHGNQCRPLARLAGGLIVVRRVLGLLAGSRARYSVGDWPSSFRKTRLK